MEYRRSNRRRKEPEASSQIPVGKPVGQTPAPQPQQPAGQPAPQQSPMQPDSQGQRSVAPPRYRQYPGLTIARTCFYVLIALTIANWALGAVVSIVSLAPVLADAPPAVAGMSTLMIGGFILLSTVGHMALILLFLVCAEGITLLMDVQDNTHEAAHYAKALTRA